MKEGLRFARFFMVLSSISPLFILWAIRGPCISTNNCVISERHFIIFCIFMFIIPNLFLGYRIFVAWKLNEKREIVVGRAEDHRDHLLVYLFTMLLPFYFADLSTWRSLSATFIALAFIIFLFWHLNLHYMNIIFAIFGYRVFTVYPPENNNPFSGKIVFVVITKRVSLSSGDRLLVYRISNTVYLEGNKCVN